MSVSKDKRIGRWLDRENLVYVRWNSVKNCTGRRGRSIKEKKSKAPNVVKPAENISQFFQGFQSFQNFQGKLQPTEFWRRP